MRQDQVRADLRIVRTDQRRGQAGHTMDITASIEPRRVVGGLISEYRRAA